MTFTGVGEALRAYENKEVELASRVNVRITEMVPNEGCCDGAPKFVPKISLYATTVGRAVLNKPLKKKEISRLINTAFRRCGLRETVIFADQLMQSGFRLATRAGISICVDDMLVPPQKETIVGEAAKKVKEYDRQYMSGL
ncbi:hypothetical protein DFQ30_005688, partial [Apophysomyces sp. BC1015]